MTTKRPHRLTDSEVNDALRTEDLAGWSRKGEVLQALFEFAGFGEAMAFMAALTPVAEQLDHHPTWTNTYNRVLIELTTHDVEGLTSLDLAFASAANQAALGR